MSDWTPEHNIRENPYRVVLKRGELIDENRDGRSVPYKIYYPTDHDLTDMPVILWSHGFGGNRDGAGFISRFIAEQGYILIHLTHIGTDSSLWEGKPGHPWDILRQTKVSRETTLNRMHDVPYVLNHLEHWYKNDEEFGKYMDLSRIGMSGHSFGAMTTQAMAGMLLPDKEQNLLSLRDKRISSGILYSPTPISHLTEEDPNKLYGDIDIPLFHMTGTDDASPTEGYDYSHRLIIHDHAGHPEQYLQVLEDGDHMVYNGTRGKLAANPKREQHEVEIQHASLAFWDAYLKDHAQAKNWLEKNFVRK
ncbi:MAG: hypothetical protein GC137_10025 [Alphaproteobacteria bacterium]|nr:hypothetical protein [Alphaproteobacteria bacterium]